MLYEKDYVVFIDCYPAGCNRLQSGCSDGGGESETGLAENFPVASDGEMPSDTFNDVISPIVYLMASTSSADINMQLSQADITNETSWAMNGEIMLTMTSRTTTDGNTFISENAYELADGHTAAIYSEASAGPGGASYSSYFIDGKSVPKTAYDDFFKNIDTLLQDCTMATNTTRGSIKGNLDDYSIGGTPYDISCEAQFSGNKTYEKLSFNPEYNNEYTEIEIWNESKIENKKAEYLSAIVRLTSKDGTVSTYALTEEQLKSISNSTALN